MWAVIVFDGRSNYEGNCDSDTAIAIESDDNKIYSFYFVL